MDIFPAIDLKGGACVRLRQGDFDAATLYEPDPLLQAQRFEQAGARWLHVVDLDGAKDGAARQTEIIEKIARGTSLQLQAGGGIRTQEDIESLMQAGAVRVVVGSLAVQEPEKVRGWLSRFGGACVVLALDVRFGEAGEPVALTRGWQESSDQTLWDVLALYKECGLRTILCTDVSCDGMMTGPNISLYKKIQDRFPDLDLLASGGVGSLEDLRALAKLGVAGAITGKALYEKRFALEDAIKEAADAR